MNCIDEEIHKGRKYQLNVHPAYHVGEKVFKMANNKIYELEITHIQIDISNNEVCIYYRLLGSTGFYSEEWMKQYTFRTKQELIESL